MANTQKYLNHLLQRTGITPACSEEERAAAETLAQVFSAHGFEPEIQEFGSSSSQRMTAAVLYIVLFVATILMFIPGVVGIIASLLVLLCAVLYVLERQGFISYPQVGPGGLSQNVIACHRACGPLASPRNRPVVVVAHYDSPRADLFSHEPLASYRPLLARALPFAAVIPGVIAFVRFLPIPGAAKVVLGVVALIVALVPLVYGLNTVLNRFVFPYTSGSVCNKSSVAAMLGVMDAVAPFQGEQEFPDDEPFEEYMEGLRAQQREAIAPSADYPRADVVPQPIQNPFAPEEVVAPASNRGDLEQGDGSHEPTAAVTAMFSALDVEQDKTNATEHGDTSNEFTDVMDPLESGEGYEDSQLDEVIENVEDSTEAPATQPEDEDVVLATNADVPATASSQSAHETSQHTLDTLKASSSPHFETPAAPVVSSVAAAEVSSGELDQPIRYGEQVLRSLGIISANCIVEYENDAQPEESRQSHSDEALSPVSYEPSGDEDIQKNEAPQTVEPTDESASVEDDSSDGFEEISMDPFVESKTVNSSLPFDELQEDLEDEDVFESWNPVEDSLFEEIELDDADDVVVAEYEELEPEETDDSIQGNNEPGEEILATDDDVFESEVASEDGMSEDASFVQGEAGEDEELFLDDEMNQGEQCSEERPLQNNDSEPLDMESNDAVYTMHDTHPEPSGTELKENRLDAQSSTNTPDKTEAMNASCLSDKTKTIAPTSADTVEALMAEINAAAPVRPPQPTRRPIQVPSPDINPATPRPSLFDLPDPGAAPIDPLANIGKSSTSEPVSSTRRFTVIDTSTMKAQNSMVFPPLPQEDTPNTKAEAPVEVVPAHIQKEPKSQEEQKRRGLTRLFGRRKKKQEDKMSDWLGVEDDFDAKQSGRDIGSWDNFQDDDHGWKGGAAGSADMSEDDLRAAVTSLGDDELLGHDIWFVATGSSEHDHAGIQAFLQAHRRDLRGVFLINLECIGAGRLAMLSREGERRVLRGDKRIMGLVTRVSADFHREIGAVDMSYLETDAHVAMGMNMRSLTLAGVEGARLACSHSEQDLPTSVDDTNVSLAADVVTEVIRRS